MRSIGLLQQRALALETEKADRQKAQAALRGKESELADVLENALEGAQQTGPNKKILWANRALLKLLGYDATEYIDHPFVDFFVERHIFEEYWQRLMRGEDVYDYPVDLRCRNGSIKHVRFHANGLWQEGKFALSRCFIRDVTEQAEAENAQRESEANLRVAKDELDPLLSNVPPRCASCRREFLYCRMKNVAVLPASCTIVWANTCLKLTIDVLKQSPEQPKLWSEATEIVNQCVSEVRTLSCLLHPPMIEELGLVSAAQWFVEGLTSRRIFARKSAAATLARESK